MFFSMDLQPASRERRLQPTRVMSELGLRCPDFLAFLAGTFCLLLEVLVFFLLPSFADAMLICEEKNNFEFFYFF